MTVTAKEILDAVIYASGAVCLLVYLGVILDTAKAVRRIEKMLKAKSPSSDKTEPGP